MAETVPDFDADEGTIGGAITGTSRWQKVVGIVGLLVVLWVGSEMYDVLYGDIGGRHGPGQNAPDENRDQEPDQEIDTDDGGGGHTPPPGDHG